ncbi:hypothetical protein, partial [Enterococcus casseliflavus]|uniref:hypothetical protein n=1 Tax=Enterococcus casseliflavus TaxID=37734 RepID=UPI003D10B2B5
RDDELDPPSVPVELLNALIDQPSTPVREPEPAVDVLPFPRFDRPLEAGVREARLLTDSPWVRSAGQLQLTVTTEGWKFPAPPPEYTPPP